jgi:hypothetical protein
MSPLETFFWGLFGGIGAEAGVVFALRHRLPSEYPYWLKSRVYYLVAGVMVFLGGGMAVAYARSDTKLNAILAIQIGASAPLILRKLSETIPEAPKPPDPAKVD